MKQKLFFSGCGHAVHYPAETKCPVCLQQRIEQLELQVSVRDNQIESLKSRVRELAEELEQSDEMLRNWQEY